MLAINCLDRSLHQQNFDADYDLNWAIAYSIIQPNMFMEFAYLNVHLRTLLVLIISDTSPY